jgi:hypothetical protein
MSTSNTYDLPARLQGVRQRFERWRRGCEGRVRTPDSLWAAAVKVANTYGVSRTAKALSVNYYALKDRMEQEAASDGDVTKGAGQDGTGATFIELAPLAPAGLCQCTVELENADGAKMRIHLQGSATPDLVALSRSLWGLDS